MAGRHELKYVVRRDQGLELMKELEPYCEQDEHADESNLYEVASIYYDAPALRFFYDREESVGFRRKVRLRGYVKGGQCTALFLEIKEKHKHTVAKKRIKYPELSLLQRFNDHTAIPCLSLLEDLPDGEVCREVSFLNGLFDLVPTCLIRYQRRTMIGRGEAGLRITLDTDLTTGGSLIYSSESELHFLDPALAVLEVKTNRAIPLWLQSLLLSKGFSRVRYSKYCEGVRLLGSEGILKAGLNENASPLMRRDPLVANL